MAEQRYDADGCTGEQTFTISSPPSLDVNVIDIISADPVSGLGGVTVVASGGVPDFNYLWDNGETEETATELTGGIHFVTITDANGCEEILQVEIPYQDLIVSESMNNPSCLNECAGMVEVLIEKREKRLL